MVSPRSPRHTPINFMAPPHSQLVVIGPTNDWDGGGRRRTTTGARYRLAALNCSAPTLETTIKKKRDCVLSFKCQLVASCYAFSSFVLLLYECVAYCFHQLSVHTFEIRNIKRGESILALRVKKDTWY